MKSDHLNGLDYYSRGQSGGFHGYEFSDFVPPLQLKYAATEQWSSGHSFHRKKSDIFGIEYVIDGNVVFVQDGREYIVERDHVYILRKNVEHHYSTGPAGMVRKHYISADGVMLESMLMAVELDSVDVVVPVDNKVIKEIFCSFMEVMEFKQAGYIQKSSTLLYRLLIELGRSVSRRYPGPVRQAIDYMDRNLGATLSTGELCDVVGLSQTHFNRLFRNSIGISPKRFFIHHKMSWAKHLLHKGYHSVKEIASILGYEDPLYFSSQFKKAAGVSPRHFMKL